MDEVLYLAIGTAIAVVVAMIKTTFPQTDKRVTFGIVIALTVAAIVVGSLSGEIAGRPLELAIKAVNLAATAMGVRAGLNAIAGDQLEKVGQTLVPRTGTGSGG